MRESPTKVSLRLLLSKWFFVAYFGLGLACFSSLPLVISWISLDKSFFLTLALMTGSDPYSFKEVIEPHGLIWGLSWLIHIASWLLIPALIALVITEAKDEIKRDQAIDDTMRRLLAAAGVLENNLDEATTETLDKIDDYIRESIKKGATHE